MMCHPVSGATPELEILRPAVLPGLGLGASPDSAGAHWPATACVDLDLKPGAFHDRRGGRVGSAGQAAISPTVPIRILVEDRICAWSRQ